MKNVSVKILAGVGALSLAAAVYSFASNDKTGEPETKKYEVIRMVNGEIFQFDTIVDVSGGYTPQDYLNDLGFGNDQHVGIVDITGFDPENMIGIQHTNCGNDFKTGEKEITIDVEVDTDEDVITDGEGKEIRIEKRILDENGEEFEFKEGEGNEIRIEKRIIIDENGEKAEDIQIDVEAIMEG